MNGEGDIVEIEAEPAPEPAVVVEPEAIAAPAAPSVPDSILSALAQKYPGKADEIAKGVEAVGAPLVTRSTKMVAVTVVDVSQDYRLNDGTVVPLETETVE